MGSTILDDVRVGKHCLIGAGALVTPRTIIPSGSLVLGSPAKIVRSLTATERRSLKGFADKYVRLAAAYSKCGMNKAEVSS